MRRNARFIISSRTGTWRCAIRSGGPIINRTLLAKGQESRPQRGFTSFADVENGAKQRIRAESFADHYSQARQFFISQTPGEQHHMAAALTFELSKVKTLAIRERLVSHLLNIDKGLANTVGEALGFKAMPKPADAAIATRQDIEPSPALGIVGKGPNSFEGRKLGILVTDGTDAAILNALKKALAKEGASFEIIAPKVGGAKASDGSLIAADQMIDGGPSVLYDAVALLPADDAMDKSGPGIDRPRFRGRCLRAL